MQEKENKDYPKSIIKYGTSYICHTCGVCRDVPFEKCLICGEFQKLEQETRKGYDNGETIETPTSNMIKDNTVEKVLFQQTRAQVVKWALERDIFTEGTIKGQVFKTQEEVGELLLAIGENDPIETNDAIGDILVCLTNLCEMLGIDIEQAYQDAYQVIKDRKGKMKNGKFIKEES